MPVIAFSAAMLRMGSLLRLGETGAALLQGKGAGTGWDMSAELHAAARYIRRSNPVLMDVGANHGKWSLGMLKLFPETQKIVLFEPQSECLSVLAEIALPDKTIVPCAVGDRSGTHAFFVGPPGWGAASLYSRAESYFSEIPQREITVPVCSLDDIMDEQCIEYVDFIKFDIEGSELFALKGASRAFDRRAIGALSFEFGSGNINSRTYFRDFWELLVDRKFEIYRILPHGQMLCIRAYYEDLEYFRGVSNYVARLV